MDKEVDGQMATNSVHSFESVLSAKFLAQFNQISYFHLGAEISKPL
jgi:hypothetical protein